MAQYQKIKTIRKLAEKLGVELKYVMLNTKIDGDIEFVYEDGVARRYYKNVEIGFEKEEERLLNFLSAANSIG